MRRADAYSTYPRDVRTAEDIEFQLALGREARGFELKGPGPADGQLLPKVIRAAAQTGSTQRRWHASSS